MNVEQLQKLEDAVQFECTSIKTRRINTIKHCIWGSSLKFFVLHVIVAIVDNNNNAIIIDGVVEHLYV